MNVLIYNIFIRAYKVAILIAAPFNKKATLWLRGRKNIFDKLSNSLAENKAPVIWMHCASLGEFEQGRTVLEKFREEYPSHKILLTFFSPSGYEIRKNYAGADWVFYLPLDTRNNAQKFIKIVNPHLVVFVKYEYWYHYLRILQANKIPTILISAIFREQSIFFKTYGGLYRKMARCFTHIFVQTEDSLNRITGIVPAEKITLAGDTRFDRVVAIATGFTPLPLIEAFAENKNLVVAGSTWPEDETMLKKLLEHENRISLIIAPHEISHSHINLLKTIFPTAILFSGLEQMIERGQVLTEKRVLIIDNIGMLSKLYKYGVVSYIGGGFNSSGIHNTLEAAVYGRPVIFGPNYQKFAEAISLIKNKAGLSYSTDNELIMAVERLYNNRSLLEVYGTNAAKFVRDNTGATDTVLRWVKKNAF